MVQWYVEIQKGEMPSLAIDASENARRRGIEEKMLNTGVEKFRHEEYFFKQLQNKKILKLSLQSRMRIEIGFASG